MDEKLYIAEQAVTHGDMVDDVEDLIRRFGVVESDPCLFWGSIAKDKSNAYKHSSEEMARADLAIGFRVFRFELIADPDDKNGVHVKIKEIK